MLDIVSCAWLSYVHQRMLLLAPCCCCLGGCSCRWYGSRLPTELLDQGLMAALRWGRQEAAGVWRLAVGESDKWEGWGDEGPE